MTSPDIASSIEDPSPTMPELVNEALGLQLEGRHGYNALDTARDTFHGIGGAIVLKRLLPELSNDSIYLLRDAITLQGGTFETASGSVSIKSASLFSGWFNKFRRSQSQIVEDIPDNPLTRIEITSPIIGRTEQAHIKSYPECHALVVQKSSLSGSFTLDDESYEFDPKNTVLEVGKLSYNPNDYQGRILPKRRRYYTAVPSTDDVYRSRRFGGSIDDEPIQDARLKRRALEDMTKVLDEIQTSSHVMNW